MSLFAETIERQWVSKVAQSRSRWQQLVDRIPDSSLPEFKSRAFKWLSVQYFGRPAFLFFSLTVSLTAAIAMLFWNWKLSLATGVGVLVMRSVYCLQVCDWHLYWSNLKRSFRGANRQLAVAVGSGGLASLSTYVAVSIGVDTESPWIAVGAMLQGLGTLGIGVLLIWQIVGRRGFLSEAKFDRMQTDLTDADPLKRLIAVRHLTRLVTKYDRSQHYAIADYFRLMLSQETEDIVRSALLDGLQVFENVRSLSSDDTALSSSADGKRDRRTDKTPISLKF